MATCVHTTATSTKQLNQQSTQEDSHFHAEGGAGVVTINTAKETRTLIGKRERNMTCNVLTLRSGGRDLINSRITACASFFTRRGISPFTITLRRLYFLRPEREKNVSNEIEWRGTNCGILQCEYATEQLNAIAIDVSPWSDVIH